MSLCLSGHPAIPDDRFDRRGWLGNISFSVSVSYYTYHQGNCKGNLDFVWETLPDNRSEKRVGSVSCIHNMLPVYATRQMKAEFINRYKYVAKVDKRILREMFRFLCDDSSAAEIQISSALEERFLKILLYNDVGIVYV